MLWLGKRSLEAFSEKNLLSAREDVTNGAGPECARAAAWWLPHLRRWCKTLTREQESAATNWSLEWWRWWSAPPPGGGPVNWPVHTSRGRAHRAIAWVALLLEGVLSYLAAPLWLNAPPVLAGLVAMLAAGLLAFVLKGIWWLRWRRRHPRLSYKQRQWWVWLTGATALVLLGVLGLTRWWVVVDTVALWVLSICGLLLPLFASGLWVLASELERRNSLYRRFSLLSEQQDRVQEVIEVAEALVESAVTESQPEDSEQKKQPVEAAAAVMSLMLILASGGSMSCVGVEQPAAGAEPLDCVGEATRLEILSDTSGSPLSGELERLRPIIADYVASQQCLESVLVKGFAEWQDAATGGALIEAPAQAKTRSEESRRTVFRAVAESELRQHQSAQIEARKEFRNELLGVLEGLGTGPAPRTCVEQVLDRAQSRSSRFRTLVITDGVAYCGEPLEPVLEAGGGDIIVILVAARGDGEKVFHEMSGRRQWIQQRVPNATVLWSWDVADRLPEHQSANQKTLLAEVG